MGTCGKLIRICTDSQVCGWDDHGVNKTMNSPREAVKQEESLSCKEPLAPVKGMGLECRRPVGKGLLKSRQDLTVSWAETGHDTARSYHLEV